MTAGDEDESARLDPTLPTVEKRQLEERRGIHPVIFILSVPRVAIRYIASNGRITDTG